MVRRRKPQYDSVRRYIDEIAAFRPLSSEEERVLARRIKDGDMEARAKLVEANLKFVITIARGYQNRGLPLADLISAGNIGLIKAAERFDPNRGFKFISFAVWWIRQSILRSLQNCSRTVRLSSTVSTCYGGFPDISTTKRRHFTLPHSRKLPKSLGSPWTTWWTRSSKVRTSSLLIARIVTTTGTTSWILYRTNPRNPPTLLL